MNKEEKKQLKTVAKVATQALQLLCECQEFFGPCWCKRYFMCPQCTWRIKYMEFTTNFSSDGKLKEMK